MDEVDPEKFSKEQKTSVSQSRSIGFLDVTIKVSDMINFHQLCAILRNIDD